MYGSTSYNVGPRQEGKLGGDLRSLLLCQERVGFLFKKNCGEFLDPFIYIYPNYTFTSVVKLGINSCSGLKKNKKAQKDISHSDTQVSLLNVGA